MSLIIKRGNPFNDSADRTAWQRYCDHHGYLVKFDDEKAEIDCFISTSNGIAAIELACNACWTIGDKYPENEDIHIPARKLIYFRRVLQNYDLPDDNDNWMKVLTGYLIIFNTNRTRAAFVAFNKILEKKSDIFVKQLNGESCEVVTIPHGILKYIDIPAK